MRTSIGVLLCAAALVSGCGTVSGQAEPENPTASDPAFDPCEDIPDEALREVGMDPATESRDILGVHQPGWRICGWNSTTRDYLTVYSTSRSLDDVRRNPDFTGFEAVVVGGRDGMSFREVGDTQAAVCDVATAVAGKAVMFSLEATAPAPPGRDVCADVRELTARLLPHIPE